MKAKLIKKNEHYFLETQPYTLSTIQRHTIIANTFDKPKGHILQLSLKNCQAIERGYDLEELAKEYVKISSVEFDAFESGFQKALELMGDKKFSEKDMTNCFKYARQSGLDGTDAMKDTPKRYIQSLQQTEWDVEIEMEGFVDEEGIYCGERPKLDAEGCLILKRI